MDLRSPSHSLGLHRVIEPEGALPQAADRLDNGEPPYTNELVIDVERLNIDAASFRQLMDAADGDTGEVADRVRHIVDNRGKMHNPVTGSGGMLIGVVRAIGPDYAGSNDDRPSDLAVGDRVATLVSLTLTPLALDSVKGVHPEADQLSVRGSAYLSPSAPVVVMPEDIDPAVALKAFDVCGAPAQTRRLVKRVDRPNPIVLMLGIGTSGMLSAAAARRTFERNEISGRIIAIDQDLNLAKRLQREGFIDGVARADATDPVGVLNAVESLLDELDTELEARQPRVDLALNTCNVGDTEMSTILPVRTRGTAYFFNMATDFTAATLGAEGVGRDIDLMMGNGYARGHAEFATTLLRDFPAIREKLAELVE